MAGAASLHWVDIMIICGYFAFVLAVGIWASIKARGGGVQGYFLAGRGMNWFLIGASLLGSNIGSEHFVGLAGSGAASGIAVAGFELNAMFIMIILGWIFLPVYITSGIYTMPEYMKKRYGGQRIRICLAAIALLLSIFTKIAADLFAGAILLKQILNWNIYAAIGLQLAVACVSTVAGGLRAVMWTDTVQVVIMILGAMTLMVTCFHKVGGYTEVVTKYFLAIPSENYTYVNSSSCRGVPPADSMNLLRSGTEGDLPWSGMIFGQTINGIWYWCSDQVIVQKALSSKNYSHAKGGCIFNGCLKFLPLWLMVFPGMVARILYPDEIACTDPDVCEKICYSRQGCSNIAYPILVVRLLPIGLRGLIIAVLMSAIMSSLSSIFNSSSTIFTMDIWRPLRKHPSNLELLFVGRIFVIFMVVVAVVWIPVVAAYPSSQLFYYVQSVMSYLAPPVAAIFILAILVPRVNEKGAFWGLITGFAIGIIRLVLEIAYSAPYCFEDDTRPLVLTKVHYLHFVILSFGFVCIITVFISVLTAPIDEKHLYRLTFWTRYSMEDRISLSEEENKTPTDNTEENTSDTRLTVMANCINVDFLTGIYENKAKKFLYFICGMDKKSDSEISPTYHKNIISLDEKPIWQKFTNISALILLTLSVFVYAFWA